MSERPSECQRRIPGAEVLARVRVGDPAETPFLRFRGPFGKIAAQGVTDRAGAGGIWMHMNPLENQGDSELLDSYCDHPSEAAFRLLVERYRPMVFGVAFGCTRDLKLAHAATDLAFAVLAKEARAIRGRVSVADWLRHAAADACRVDAA